MSLYSEEEVALGEPQLRYIYLLSIGSCAVAQHLPPSPPKMTNVLVGSAADKNLIHVEPLNDSTINRIAMSQREYKC